MPRTKKLKRTFRFHIKAKGAKKEIQKGMGVGVIGYIDYTFNLPPEQYNTTTFAMSLLDLKRKALDEFIEVHCEEVKE